VGAPLYCVPGKTGTGAAVTRLAIRDVASAVAGLFFPARCHVCDRVIDGITRVPVCDACWNAISPFPAGALCRICGLPGPAELSVYECELCVKHPPHFSIARSLGEYGGVLRELLHLLKYNGMEPVGRRLGECLAEIADTSFRECEAVIAVPLDPARQRTRGYNQAERIARSLARCINLPLLPGSALRRVRSTSTQIGLTREERRANMRDAFAADRALVADRRLLLIDDVMTTGATIDACAIALRSAGAREVMVLTVARTPQHEITF
jgi:ComF family protein